MLYINIQSFKTWTLISTFVITVKLKENKIKFFESNSKREPNGTNQNTSKQSLDGMQALFHYR